MMRWCVVSGAMLIAAHAAAAAPRVGAADLVSPLALERGGSGGARDWLAQRAIVREWPVPGDSGVTLLPHGRSELGALIFSAAAPGAGQLYAGQTRGLYYAAAEVVGWLGWVVLRHKADDLRDQARGFAGSPTDSTSAWSFARYEQATSQDASNLRALYGADPDAFDQAIASDPRYAAGWAAPQDRAEFSDLRQRSDRRLSQSRATEGALWINHVVSALDALRAARAHNRALGHGLELKTRGGWRDGRPDVQVAVERRF